MKLTSTSHRSVKLVFLGSSKKINSNYNGQFNSTNKDPTDLKTAQKFPNSIFFNTLVFPPIFLKIPCKRDTLSLRFKVAASGQETMARLNVVDYLTSLVRTGYSLIIILEQMGSMCGSHSMCKMAATTCSIVSRPDRETSSILFP